MLGGSCCEVPTQGCAEEQGGSVGPGSSAGGAVSCDSDGAQPSVRVPRKTSRVPLLGLRRNQSCAVGFGAKGGYGARASRKCDCCDDTSYDIYGETVDVTKKKVPELPQSLMNKKLTPLPPSIMVIKKQQIN